MILLLFLVPSTINLGNLTITVNDDNNNNIKLRTFGILISYSVISTLWILLSLVVLTCVCVPFTSRVAKIYFWPWFISIVLGSVLDMIATVFHIFDILHTTVSPKHKPLISPYNEFQNSDLLISNHNLTITDTTNYITQLIYQYTFVLLCGK